MLEPVLMTVPPGIAPRTKDGSWGIIMLLNSGSNDKVQWFDYRPTIYDTRVRAEWPLGTMAATVPQPIAEVLLEGGYARIMTLDEARSYNKSVERLSEKTVKLDVA